MSTRLFLLLTLVFSVSTLASYAAWRLGSQSLLHLLWAVALPLALAFHFKRKTVDRLALGVLLTIASFLGIGLTANLIGYP